ncbi:MAG: glucosaminidase domain-containing protein [Crocinitomicaceae bacterium]
MKLFFLTGFIALTTLSFAETKITTVEYIEMWKSTAVKQMQQHKIPASITLAQGILESGNGNSKLAKEANNHFGIKCHKKWTGDTFIQDDDTKDECFRSYLSAEESYNDHSQFLTGRGRYAGLFELRKDDYKGWAKGLKSAGYATNPKYAYLLINLIERYHLNQYDKLTIKSISSPKKQKSNTIISSVEPKKQVELKSAPVARPKSATSPSKVISNYSGGIDEIQINENAHVVSISENNVKYVIVKGGDTFYRLSKEFGLTIAQLYKYNEFKNKDVLEVDDRIYISPKKSRGHRSNSNYIASQNMTYRDIAHEQGIKLNSLLKLNLSENPDATVSAGSKVTLR